ncbi:hypothetical protein Fot_28079 [Forsythia ovata]|uniref:Uncharacterized protein n=1 Tax=Forsythia ovata TaxID=205694 RepID=A0ABD1TN08_9LAMI
MLEGLDGISLFKWNFKLEGKLKENLNFQELLQKFDTCLWTNVTKEWFLSFRSSSQKYSGKEGVRAAPLNSLCLQIQKFPNGKIWRILVCCFSAIKDHWLNFLIAVREVDLKEKERERKRTGYNLHRCAVPVFDYESSSIRCFAN